MPRNPQRRLIPPFKILNIYFLARFLYYSAIGTDESHRESPRYQDVAFRSPGLAAVRRPDTAVGFPHCACGFDVSRGVAAERNHRDGLRYTERLGAPDPGTCRLRLA